MTESTSKFESLFPMRISSIERFHLLDDSGSFPNNLFCRFSFRGKIDIAKMIEAIQFCESRHPMLCAVLETDNSGNPRRWIEARTDQLASANLAIDERTGPSADESDSFCVTALNLAETCGLRIYLRPGNDSDNDRAEVVVQVHHAIFDGGGGIQVINDWMIAYDNLDSGRPVGAGAKRLNRSLIRQRSSLGLTRWSYLRHLYKQPIGLMGATKFLFRSFAKLGNDFKPEPTESFETSPPVRADQRHPDAIHTDYPRIRGRWIESDDYKRLRVASESAGVNMNSVLLSRLYHAIDEFRCKSCSSPDPDAWIRVIVPMSIRDAGDRRMSAANRSAVVQVDRRQQNMNDPDAFLQFVDREIGIIRFWQLSKLFLIAIRTMAVIPFLLKRSAHNPNSRGTLIFTNLGTPFSRNRRLHGRGERQVAGHQTEIGNLKLESFDLSGPIKPGTPVNFTLQEHLGRLRVSMHLDPRRMSVDDAEHLFDLYVERLKS